MCTSTGVAEENLIVVFFLNFRQRADWVRQAESWKREKLHGNPDTFVFRFFAPGNLFISQIGR